MPSPRRRPEDGEKALGLALRQCRGRLVEHEHARVMRRAPWRSRPAGARRATGSRPLVSRAMREAEPVQRRLRAVAHRGGVEQADAAAARVRARCSARRSGWGAGSVPDRRWRCRARSPSCVEAISAGLPARPISPASGASMPETTLIIVDLPAPFWPMTAWISPRRTVSDASSSASTPGKRLVRARSSRAGGSVLGHCSRRVGWAKRTRAHASCPPHETARVPKHAWARRWRALPTLLIGLDDVLQRLLEGEVLGLRSPGRRRA